MHCAIDYDVRTDNVASEQARRHVMVQVVFFYRPLGSYHSALGL